MSGPNLATSPPSIIPPLVSIKNSRLPLNLSFRSFAAECSSSPTMLSSMTILAPAEMASSASARDWHSTLTNSEKPATRRTDLTALVIDPTKRQRAAQIKESVTESGARPTSRPDVIVLEHDHTAQIVSMGINTPYHHSVLLHQPETRCRLSRTGYRSLPSSLSRSISEST